MIVGYLGPVIALVLRVPQHALLGFDQRVYMARVGGPDRERDAAQQPRRQAVLEPSPGEAAVGGAIDAAPAPAGHELPRVAHELPHPCEQDPRVAGHHHQVGHARRVVHEQHLLPRLAAVRGAEHAPIGVGGPHVAQRPDQDDVRVEGVDHDPRDLPDVAETHELPGLARVGRHEHTAAVHHVVARVPLACPHPHDIGVRRRQGEGTNRCRRLVFEHGLPGIAAIGRLPHAARGCPDVVRAPIAGHADDGRHATTAHRGPEVSELQVVERVRSHRRGRGRRGRGSGSLFRPGATLRRGGQGERRHEHAAEAGLTESRAMHRNKLLRWVMIARYENSYPARWDDRR